MISETNPLLNEPGRRQADRKAGKTRLYITILLGLLTVSFIYISPFKETVPPQPNNGDEFLIGAFNSGYDLSYDYLDTLDFNIWHLYNGANRLGADGRHYADGWTHPDIAPGDSLFADYNAYVSQVQNVLTDVNDNEMKALMMRPKIEWLAFGQRSDYQCESTNLNPDLWFYSFNDHLTGESTTDSGQGVIHCRTMPANPSADDPGFVVKRLKANTEQCNPGGEFRGDSECDWLIKPRMRIDSTIADNPNNWENNVFRIIALNQNRDTIKNLIVKVKNFLDEDQNYNGRYLEEYFFGPNDSTLSIHGNWGDWYSYGARGTRTIQQEQDTFNHADIQVWWYGNCDMWIDYVRVDNDVADKLFKGYWDDPNHPERQWLQWEGHDIACHNDGAATYRFYIELFEFNNIPCMSYVSHKLDSIAYSTCGKHATLMSIPIPFTYSGHVPWSERLTVQNVNHFKTNFIEKMGVTEFMMGIYPFNSSWIHPEVYPNYDTWTRIPNTLPTYDVTGVLAQAIDPEDYDDWLQEYFDDAPYSFESGYPGTEPRNPVTEDPGGYRYNMQFADAVSKATDLPFIYNPEIHIWYCRCGATGTAPPEITGEVQREPTNEELDLDANLSVSYGARGIVYFQFISGQNNIGDRFYDRGIMEPWNPITGQLPRYLNVYGQEKWKKVVELSDRLRNRWGQTLMSFNNADRHSYIYRLERTDCLDETYFTDLYTYKIASSYPQCNDDFPENDVPPQYTVGECKEFRYLQVATFENPNEDNTNYFMIVNRRCSPFINDQSETNNGGRRFARVKFDNNHPEMVNFNNWKITDIASDGWTLEFNKTLNTVLDLGWFQPGEGKLYKMEPVAKSGGIFAGDELIESGENFTCEDTVWTNGHNLTIEDGVTIHFSDSAKFVVHGGTFQIGNSSHSGPNTINMDADNSSWKGFVFDSATVKIYGVNFSELANDSISMLTFIDCPVIDLRSNLFSLGSNSNVGAIDINYSGSYGSSITDNIYIANNTFTGSNAVLPHVKVMAYSGITTPVIVEGNNFTGTSTALFLNNIQGGAIKSNTFTGFGTAVTALSSSLDVYSNTVSSSGTYGIQALEGTELKMSYAGGLLVGGRNDITNSGSNSDNIYLENSYFLMDEGENIFDIGTDSYHLYGWFPDSYSSSYEETENCFKVQGSVVDPPLHYVTLGEQGNQITDFVFTPYLTGCTQGGEGDMMVINLGNGIYDTIGIMGEGGSRSSKFVISPKTIYDSISISMRFRNYANVKTLCLQLLNSYPDSVQSLGAISKLYLAVSKTDTTSQGITDLKTLYENLILNHQGNISLVKRCNYYVQKCKVLLHQYSSALFGFQQIINNNPASYEGLIARWDYMATSLLMQGQGGALSGVEGRSERNWVFESDESDEFDKSDKFDDDKFSREERKQIKQAVTTALEISKSTEKKRREVLTELSTRGDVKATKQLKVLKSLEQTVKVERPKNIVEHMKIVAGDIQKVFVNPNAGKNANTTFIPQVFRLAQNYPNPFNPVTKINYDIPQNSIVKLIIYDILGREVIKLVNNEFKQPGRYVVEFNGTNLASGVYFYRIEAGDFIDSKKMVLIK